MPEFRKITFDDAEKLRNYFNKIKSHSCDTTVGVAYMWRDYFETSIAEIGDELLFRTKYTDNGEYAFLFPFGEKCEELCKTLEKYCNENDIKLRFYSVTDDRMPQLLEIYPDAKISSERKWADYLYEAEKIKNLTGKKYSAQRNHINKFKRLYDDYSFEEITENDIDECLDLMDNRMEHKSSEFAVEEMEKVKETLAKLDVLRLKTAVLRINGTVAGFSCAEQTGDMLTIHIEKADTSFDGVYPMLTHLFLEKYVDDSIAFVNREDDAGDEGLRKSKLSYNPCELITKNFVEV